MPMLEKLMQADLNTYLPFNQLAYCDRMSMACSLEVARPLCRSGAGQACGPDSAPPKAPAWENQGAVPRGNGSISSSRSPERAQAGLEPSHRPLVPKRITRMDAVAPLAGKNRARGYFVPESVQEILSEHDSGKRDRSLFIWAILVLEIWHQIYMDDEIKF